ncbi:MAG: YigZ family protein [Bacteroidaceae bacterium]|nr:YigZ family protein [Bacteroidaceae bacterium]
MIEDSYTTIEGLSEAIYTEKRSKFLAFAIPVESLDTVKEIVDAYQKKYYDARHVCYAYMLGADRNIFRANDNGEPSGTAGKPILGQIRSKELTDILVVVVRYFGGIKLGTGGLVVAYKTAAAVALEKSVFLTKTVDVTVRISFEYCLMNDVMRVVKEMEPTVLERVFEMDCRMSLSIRKSLFPDLLDRLTKIERLRVEEE